MRARTLLLLIVLLAVTVFAALNWRAFVEPTTLSLAVGTVEAPLGLVMLGVTALLTVLFLVYVVYLQTTVLFDARRHARELRANRELADQAEASRFTALRTFLEAELTKLAGQDAGARTAMEEKLDRISQELRTAVEESNNSLAAYIGELEDRIERGSRDPNP